MKVKVDKEKCIGCGACASVCPEAFVMDEAACKAKVKKATTNAKCVKEAADSCPVQAISVN